MNQVENKSDNSPKGASRRSKELNVPLIVYLDNPDKVYYNTMDDEIIENLEKEGVIVTKVSLDQISFNVSKDNDHKTLFYVDDSLIALDGFLSYGYMSEFHFKAYSYIVHTLNEMGIPTLHSPEAESVLNDKYLQLLKYKKGEVPIPSTNIGFSVQSYKSITKNSLPNESVVKTMSDYASDGVEIHKNSSNALNHAAKLLWKNTFCLFQELVKDSPGKSVRVLVMDGKPVACAEFEDKTGNMKSNCNFGMENFSLNSLMQSSKRQEYYDLAMKACNSVGKSLTIAGVDILDSKQHGMVVLETNPWPDIYDIARSTGQYLFDQFAKGFCNKVHTWKMKREKSKTEYK